MASEIPFEPPAPASAMMRDSSSIGGASCCGTGAFAPAGGRTSSRPPRSSLVSAPSGDFASFPHLTELGLPITRGVAGARTPGSLRRSRSTLGNSSFGASPVAFDDAPSAPPVSGCRTVPPHAPTAARARAIEPTRTSRVRAIELRDIYARARTCHPLRARRPTAPRSTPPGSSTTALRQPPPPHTSPPAPRQLLLLTPTDGRVLVGPHGSGRTLGSRPHRLSSRDKRDGRARIRSGRTYRCLHANSLTTSLRRAMERRRRSCRPSCPHRHERRPRGHRRATCSRARDGRIRRCGSPQPRGCNARPPTTEQRRPMRSGQRLERPRAPVALARAPALREAEALAREVPRDFRLLRRVCVRIVEAP